MATATDTPARSGDNEAPPAAARSGFDWNSLLTARWLAIVVVASLVLHATGFALVKWRERPAAPQTPEIGLGKFHFVDPGSAGVTKADFSLHISLNKESDPLARQQLSAVRYKLQQDIEELLRRAHGNDFVDPGLEELKRQLQAQVNTTLGLPAVSEVIITGLALERSPAAATEASPAPQQVAPAPQQVAPAPRDVATEPPPQPTAASATPTPPESPAANRADQPAPAATPAAKATAAPEATPAAG